MDWTGLLDILAENVTGTFGEPVFYTRVVDGYPEAETEIRAVFDPDFALTDPGPGNGVNSRVPVIDVRNSDIGGEPSEGDIAIVQGIAYEVTAVHPSSSGMTKAQLKRKARRL